MADRHGWLDEGLPVLAELGATGLRIDRLAARLGLSKGSFYHHFAGLTGYRRGLLDHYERQYTTRYIDALTDSPSRQRRTQLVSLDWARTPPTPICTWRCARGRPRTTTSVRRWSASTGPGWPI